ncbi:MAG: conjugative transposon protein TraM [Rikenellaceae bacterium]
MKESTKQKMRRIISMMTYPLLGLVSCLAVWFSFTAGTESADEMAAATNGANMEVPSAARRSMAEDKQKSYEQEILNQKRKQRKDSVSLNDVTDKREAININADKQQIAQAKVATSAKVNTQINSKLKNFYTTPKVDSEKEQLRKQVEELKADAARRDASRTPEAMSVDDQMALMERSYELAAKYNSGNTQVDYSRRAAKSESPNYNNGKAVVNAVASAKRAVVSSLSADVGDANFNTAVRELSNVNKNTIKACVDGNQTVTSGQSVRLRLLESIQAGDVEIPSNTVVIGMTSIRGERLGISISALSYGEAIIPVSLVVADTDGQEGIFIPGSLEINAFKEIVANMGRKVGTTINLSDQSAGDQLLAELGTGTIQGISEYAAKKVSQIKVHLKDGYTVMLH